MTVKLGKTKGKFELTRFYCSSFTCGLVAACSAGLTYLRRASVE